MGQEGPPGATQTSVGNHVPCFTRHAANLFHTRHLSASSYLAGQSLAIGHFLPSTADAVPRQSRTSYIRAGKFRRPVGEVFELRVLEMLLYISKFLRAFFWEGCTPQPARSTLSSTSTTNGVYIYFSCSPSTLVLDGLEAGEGNQRDRREDQGDVRLAEARVGVVVLRVHPGRHPLHRVAAVEPVARVDNLAVACVARGAKTRNVVTFFNANEATGSSTTCSGAIKNTQVCKGAASLCIDRESTAAAGVISSTPW